ncbi:hypothetical protein M8C21_008928 [Ambrosia artemisiifolia]|uniref:WAT1-related protein n=1 Tax=Ambrosia artemisiifolia TaxID=4212 RepID=A0AAD5G9Z0_AMBAR|nr:hypothetical protein M8C21_008928 [Ambrosia artemisiifolia]
MDIWGSSNSHRWNIWLHVGCFTNINNYRVPGSTNHCLFLLPLWDNPMYSSFSFPRTKSKRLGTSTWNWGDSCCFWVYSTAFRKSVVTWCLRKKGPVFVATFSPLSIVVAVIMGVTFLGDSLHLGSIIGATIVSAGVYTVLWGQTKEKTKLLVVMDEDLDVTGSSINKTARLLPSSNESEC